MIAPKAGLSVSRQCALLGVVRSSFYYRPRPESAEELEILKRLDRIFTGHPVYGSRRLQVALLREGVSVGRRRIRRLMRKLIHLQRARGTNTAERETAQMPGVWATTTRKPAASKRTVIPASRC